MQLVDHSKSLQLSLSLHTMVGADLLRSGAEQELGCQLSAHPHLHSIKPSASAHARQTTFLIPAKIAHAGADGHGQSWCVVHGQG